MPFSTSDLQMLLQRIELYSHAIPLFVRCHIAPVLHSAQPALKEVQTYCIHTEQYLLNERSLQGTWAYADTLPPDIDDTVIALEVLTCTYLNDASNDDTTPTPSRDYFHGECIGAFAQALKVASINESLSGPFRTWLLQDAQQHWDDVDYVINANVVTFFARHGATPQATHVYVSTIAQHELELPASEARDFVEENTRYYRYRGFRRYLLWRWASVTSAPILKQYQEQAQALETLFDAYIVSKTPSILKNNYEYLCAYTQELIDKVSIAATPEHLPVSLCTPLYVERVAQGNEQGCVCPALQLALLFSIATNLNAYAPQH